MYSIRLRASLSYSRKSRHCCIEQLINAKANSLDIRFSVPHVQRVILSPNINFMHEGTSNRVCWRLPLDSSRALVAICLSPVLKLQGTWFEADRRLPTAGTSSPTASSVIEHLSTVQFARDPHRTTMSYDERVFGWRLRALPANRGAQLRDPFCSSFTFFRQPSACRNFC